MIDCRVLAPGLQRLVSQLLLRFIVTAKVRDDGLKCKRFLFFRVDRERLFQQFVSFIVLFAIDRTISRHQ